jgi:thymidylate synthase (FAD)
MKVIKPSFSILGNPDGEKILQFIEIAGRVCYKSEAKITHESSKTFVLNLIKNKHESVLEHQSISVKIICDCGISKEITRHRIASFSQLSTRYYNCLAR